jgi:tyrosinase
MTGPRVTRRRFLEMTGAATAVLVGPSLLEPASALAVAPYTRLDVGTLSASSPTIVSYKTAIQAMNALPTSNPLSWTYQAAIHGTLSSASFPAWNTCEHGTYFFHSWHRMYLWYFERIIRKMSGDPNWALPYWNYESASQRNLPEVFRSPADMSNVLYVATPNRGPGWNAGTASLNASAVETAAAFNEVPFNDFTFSLETTPHNAVHVSIGGWMGSVPTAAQDPIFWLHHCNIDRLWNLWLAQGGGRTDPLTDTTWTATKFKFFDENGKQVQLTGCDILRAQKQLDYVYQGESKQVELFCLLQIPPLPKYVKRVLIRIPPERSIVLPPTPDPVPFDIDIGSLRQRLLRTADDPDTDLTLDLDSVEADRQPDVYYEVYVGLPNGATPDSRSPFYVGNIALFGRGVRGEHQHGGFHPASFAFKIDRAISASLRRNNSAGRLTVLFVPRGASLEGRPAAVRPLATVRIGSVAVSTRRLQRNER